MSGLVIDAAFPPPAVPAGVTGIMGYIGGAAEHVWSPGEWAPFHAVRQYPIWVIDFTGDPVRQGLDAIVAAENRGWAPHLPANETRVIVFDAEDKADPAWYAALAPVVETAGFVPVVYGSLSTVLGNAASDVLAADWDGIKAIPAGQTIHGVQYAANLHVGSVEVDWNLFDEWLMARGGVGPRRGA
jgi:hypothetical protein